MFTSKVRFSVCLSVCRNLSFFLFVSVVIPVSASDRFCRCLSVFSICLPIYMMCLLSLLSAISRSLCSCLCLYYCCYLPRCHCLHSVIAAYSRRICTCSLFSRLLCPEGRRTSAFVIPVHLTKSRIDGHVHRRQLSSANYYMSVESQTLCL